MKAKAKHVYLVHHFEIFEHDDHYHGDAAVLHVASSLPRAVKFIKDAGVEPFSWWEVTRWQLDRSGMDDGESVGIYGCRGGKLKAHPFKQAVAAYKKCKADPNHPLNKEEEE